MYNWKSSGLRITYVEGIQNDVRNFHLTRFRTRENVFFCANFCYLPNFTENKSNMNRSWNRCAKIWTRFEPNKNGGVIIENPKCKYFFSFITIIQFNITSFFKTVFWTAKLFHNHNQGDVIRSYGITLQVML